jgi:hypothetical protein
MGHKQLSAALLMLQDKTFVDVNLFKQWLCFSGQRVSKRIEALFCNRRIPVVPIMVPVDIIKSSLMIKILEELEYLVVGIVDVFIPPVFEQFVPIPDLNVSKSSPKVVLQGIRVNSLIASKLIRPAVIAPVNVAEEHHPGMVMDGKPL